MKRILTIISSIFICISIYSFAQGDTAKYDSIYKIIKQKNVSISKKIKAINSNINKFDTQEAMRIWNIVAEDCKKEKYIDGLVFCYCQMANLTMDKNDEESAEKAALYLDSARIYANKITNINALALYNLTQGTYNQLAAPDKKETYNYLYKALFYYIKAGNKSETVMNILMTIGKDASIRDDTVSLKQILAKVRDVKSHYEMANNAELELSTTELYSDLYKIRYRATKKEYCIDSIVYYENAILSRYEGSPNEMKPSITDAAISLLSIIKYEANRKEPDLKKLDSYIRKVEEMAKQIHSPSPVINIKMEYVKSLIAYRRNQLDIAKEHILRANEHMSNYRTPGYRQLYASNYELLGNICEANGDYKGAIENDNKRNDFLLEIRDNKIKMFELQYNNEVKKDEIATLYGQNKYQQTRKKQIIAICILFALTEILMLLILFNKHKYIRQNAALEKKSKEEAELQLKLKEEQAKQAQLEKYEVLSDFHLQEMELIGKSKKLEQLKEEKKILDEKVEQFSNKVSEYENAAYTQDNNNSNYPICDVIVEDLKQLIEKKLKDSKDYTTKLENEINENYISFIKKKYDGHITVQYIKYCICIAIGMEPGDINECFSIERASVHALRYRLKKKFRLDAETTLDAFLIQNKNVSNIT